MKNQFNLSRPKFGVKHYVAQDTTMKEPYYKILNVNMGKKE